MTKEFSKAIVDRVKELREGMANAGVIMEDNPYLPSLIKAIEDLATEVDQADFYKALLQKYIQYVQDCSLSTFIYPTPYDNGQILYAHARAIEFTPEEWAELLHMDDQIEL